MVLRRALRAVLSAGILLGPILATSQAPQAGAPAIAPAPPEPPAATPPPPPVAPAPPAAPPVPAAALPARPASAPPPEPVAWFLEVGNDWGRNELYRFEFPGGSRSVSANDGFHVGGGASFWPLSGGRFRTQLSAGMKWTAQAVGSAEVEYRAFPVELLETLDLAPFRLGAGVHALLWPKVKGSGELAPMTTSLKNTLGLTARAEVRLAGMGIGVRYLWNRLSAEGGGSMSAPAWGAYLSFGGARPHPAPPPPAAPAPLDFAWVLEMGGDVGRNVLYTVAYSNGDVYRVEANTGLFLQGGATFWPLLGGKLRTQLVAGLKGTFQHAANGDIDYYAFPVEVIERLDLGRIRLGAGAYALIHPRVKADGLATPINTTMKSSLGFTVRAEYRWEVIGVGVRYVWNRLQGDFGGSMSAPALGIVVSITGA